MVEEFKKLPLDLSKQQYELVIRFLEVYKKEESFKPLLRSYIRLFATYTIKPLEFYSTLNDDDMQELNAFLDKLPANLKCTILPIIDGNYNLTMIQELI